MGTCSITIAELRDILESLNLAWDLAIKKLRVQMDSRTPISLLGDVGGVEHQHASLVLEF
ncbi:hypothetical protein LINPERPRIM_LOCUS23044 [Linum perenne]